MSAIRTRVQLQTVDPDDAVAFARWYDVVEQARRAERPHEPDWQLQELRALARAGRPGTGGPEDVHTLVAVDEDGRTVGAAQLGLPQRDNRHLGWVEHLAVLPDERRCGIGTALLAAVDRLCAQGGRRDLLLEVQEQPGVPSPGRAFVERAGFSCAQVEQRRDLDLPADPERLARLERACAPYAADYDVRTWADRCPEHLLEDRALLGRRMSTDAPLGDVPLEEEHWDAARLRHAEQVLREQGRTRLTAAAVHRPTGRLVAFTEIDVHLDAPERAFQSDTLVLREHRGHRLGTLLKVANLRRVVQQSPRTRVVSTWNAQENGPMIAVNDALGCRVVGTLGEWLRAVSPAGATPGGAASGG